MDYTLAVGTHDPYGFSADTELAAIRVAVRYIDNRYAAELKRNPQEVVTLLGPDGLVTRPTERLDEFVRRLPERSVMDETGQVQPGDTNTPDCNSD